MAKTRNSYVINNVSPVYCQCKKDIMLALLSVTFWANLFMNDEDKHIFYYWKLAETLVVWVSLIGDFSSPLLSMQEMKRT